MTRGLAARLALTATCLAASLVPVTDVAARTFANPPTITIARPQWALGETMVVRGANWPAGVVSVQVCGSNGIHGTKDCDMPSSRTIGVGSGGEFGMQLTVSAPPVPCPCVVQARGVTGDVVVVAPISLPEHTYDENFAQKPSKPSTTTLSVTMSLATPRSWRDYVGVSPQRMVRVTVSNTGSLATGDGSIDLTVGKDFPPLGYGTILKFDSIAPGESTELVTTLPLDSFAYGDYWVKAEVASPRAQAATGAMTSTFPSGALAALVGVVLLADIAVVRKVRRRSRAHREALAAAAAAESIDATPSMLLRPRGNDRSPMVTHMPAAFPVTWAPPATSGDDTPFGTRIDEPV
ncbi:MAG: hypothetical protein RI900_3133 [Actinomycetota bacterium]